MMMKGDCTGPVSSQFVLKDPTVDFAVLECARGGILKAGLAFQNCGRSYCNKCRCRPYWTWRDQQYRANGQSEISCCLKRVFPSWLCRIKC